MVAETYSSIYRIPITTPVDWRPYLAGAGIGVLSWAAFAIADNPIGVTTAFSQLAGGLAIPVLGTEYVAQNSYWARYPLAIDYGTLFLVGLVLGGLVSSLLSRSFRFETVPTVWRERFGGSVAKRFAAAFVGGAIAMYGARLAGGCTSGHGISGGLQLAVSSWLFLAVMFATGLVTAAVMFRGKQAA
jgi:uncharacterized membrane protein YedE/YeeE